MKTNLQKRYKNRHFLLFQLSSDHDEYIGSKGYWTKVHIFQMAQQWASNTTSNYGMVVNFTDTAKNQVAVTNGREMPDKVRQLSTPKPESMQTCTKG